ncbi:MAG: helix-turn-helix transcriptional regulator [Micromonosporaceae bacterium]
MRASRLVSLLLLLQSRGRMTARQLAGELEVSVRTVYRDTESLVAAGVPLYGDQTGYQLVDGYRTRLTGLTGEEAESLFLAGLPGPAAELGLGATVAATQLKLLAALPAELRHRAERISARFHLDAPSWYQDGDQVPHLTAAADAVWRQRVIRVRYRRWKAPQEVTRTLRPYGLVLKAGRWYLVARHRSRVATYRVSQLLALQTREETFTRPEGFDLAAHWRAYLAEWDARRYTGTATIRLSPRGIDRFPDCFPPVVAQAAARTAVPDERDGWTRVEIPIESVGHATGDLLRLGADVEVLSPQPLRTGIATAVRELAEAYRC